jgi:magnesium-protoporphyrin O-methyltransferase
MSCCQTEASAGTGRFFSRRARHFRRRFRRRGLDRIQRLLVDGIAAAPIKEASILEIGCGVGGLHLALLARGAGCAVGVDISEEMIRHARELARDMGMNDRTAYIAGDVVVLAPELSRLDIVVLDKVVCCYEDLPRLLDVSLGRAERTYALSYPRGMTRWGFAALALLARILRWSFYPRWHDWAAMLARIQHEGFSPRFSADTLFWSVRVFERG